MNPPEGAKTDIGELLKRLGEDALVREAEAAGLSPKARRMRCPFASCAHKGADRERDAQIFAGGHPRIWCWACSTRGDLIDLVEITRGLNRQEAIAHVTGQPVPTRPMPQLRVINSPEEDPTRLKPAEVQRLWDKMAVTDAVSVAYLETRGLDGCPWVRFATDQHPDKRVTKLARQGYRIAVLLTDVTGNPRGIQIRMARQPRNRQEPKIKSITGSSTGRAYFGRADLIEAEPMVCVAEGLADTVALQLWAGSRPGVTVAGVAGKDNIPKLAEELETAGIPLEGKLFALFTQNDRPQNKSRREFVRLGQRLTALGARVVTVNTDDEYGDLAEWLQAKPDQDWPPEEIRKAYQPQPGRRTPRGTSGPSARTGARWRSPRRWRPRTSRPTSQRSAPCSTRPCTARPSWVAAI
jgi:hypothetical protein